MSKPVKELIQKQYEGRFADLDGAVLINIRGISALNNNTLRSNLAQKGISIAVVKNSLARKAFQGTAMENIGELLQGPCALVYGGESVVNVARELIAQAKQVGELEFKGALMEGQIFGPGEVDRLSKFPTREEAISNVLGAILGPGAGLMGAVMGPAGTVGALIKAIEEKLEKGETIQKSA